MAQSKSSRRWLQEHFSDPYVKKAQVEGWRSRAAYKLIELDEKYRFLKSCEQVVDLGAAPGGWSQVAAQRIGGTGRILATDLLPMDPLAGVNFVQGDFTEDRVFEQLLGMLEGRQADFVLSDMAPNMSGMQSVDQPKAMLLAEMALEFSIKVLGPKGGLILKAFHGEGLDAFIQDVRRHFLRVAVRKPRASRDRSRETYIVALGRKI